MATEKHPTIHLSTCLLSCLMLGVGQGEIEGQSAETALHERLADVARGLADSRAGWSTWSGTVRVTQTIVVTDPVVVKGSGVTLPINQHDPPKLEPIPEIRGQFFRTDEAEVRFDLDWNTPGFRSHWVSVRPAHYVSVTNPQLTLDEPRGLDFIGIVTPDEFLSFDRFSRALPVDGPGAVRLTRDVDENQVSRAAYREPPSAARKLQDLGHLFDPRSLFRAGGAFPEERLDKYAEQLRAGNTLPVTMVEEPDGSGMLRMTMNYRQTHEVEPSLEVITRFRPTTSNRWVLVSEAMRYLPTREQPDVEHLWEWEAVGEWMVPRRVADRRWDRRTERLEVERVVELINSEMNVALPAETLTIEGLGVEAGDLFVDNVRHVTQRVGDHGTPDATPAIGTPRNSLILPWLIAGNLVVASILFVWLRGRKTQPIRQD
jgi:hypothetical protein